MLFDSVFRSRLLVTVNYHLKKWSQSKAKFLILYTVFLAWKKYVFKVIIRFLINCGIYIYLYPSQYHTHIAYALLLITIILVCMFTNMLLKVLLFYY